MSTKIQIETFNSIEHVPCESWNSVAGESVGLNHRMLLCRERSYQESDQSRYFLLKSSNTPMAVGVAVICGASIKQPISHRLFGRLAVYIKPLVRPLDRTLVCGLIPGPGAAILTRSDSDHPYWIRLICQSMEEYAGSKKLNMSYVNVLPEQSLLKSELHRQGYLQGIDHPIATLRVKWHDQESYLNCLRARKTNYAATARTEIRRFHKSGIRISRWNGIDNSTVLYELLRDHYESKNTAGFQFGPELLQNFMTYLKNDCIVYIARKTEALAGVFVVIRRNETAWVRIIGIDHTVDAQNFTYFNLAYYYPLSEFSSLGIRRVFYGKAVQYAKYRRGCDIVDTRFFVKFRSSILSILLRPLFLVQRYVFTKKYFDSRIQGEKNVI